ncbi:amidohydrolase family protein [Parasphingorhabdus sp.]|uniref:amidohydrolase family protein n=1 Tax=Parasphingorhabdus sp. TaxID=2709688 RepID=UPI003A8EC78D
MVQKNVDTLITGATVITMDSDRHIIIDGALAIDDGLIVAVGSSADVQSGYCGRRTIDADGQIITPGFINGHVHITGDPLTRGFMPDTVDYRDPANFERWVLPRFASHKPEDEHVSAKLAALEMLKCGITCFIEAGTVRHLDEAVAGLDMLGIRARVSPWTEGRAFDDTQDAAELEHVAIEGLERATKAWPAGASNRIEAWPILIGHNVHSDGVWHAAKSIADRDGSCITAHMSPYQNDTDWYLATYGRRPVEHLADLGVLGPNMLLTHVTHLSESECDLLVEHRSGIIFCPLAAIKGGFDVAGSGRQPELVARGVPMLLGTDGYDCDLMRQMPIAAGLFKMLRKDNKLFPCHQMLEMITIGAAEALGLADIIGSLAVGKRADLIFHDTNRPELRPLLNPVNQLVWSADGRGVNSVWIDGECLIEGGRSTRIDEDDFFAKVQESGTALIERAGLPFESPWPIVGGTRVSTPFS